MIRRFALVLTLAATALAAAACTDPTGPSGPSTDADRTNLGVYAGSGT